MKIKFKSLVLTSATLLAMSSFNVSYAQTKAKKPLTPIQEEQQTYEMLSLFGQVLDLVKTSYVKKVDTRILIEGALKGMISALDPHSFYVDEKSFNKVENDAKGQFGGIGIRFIFEDKTIKVMTVMDNTPASKVHLKSKDLIVGIDNKSVRTMEEADIIKAMRGKAGSKVVLTVVRNNKKPFNTTLTRAIIKDYPTVSKLIDNDVAYLRINSFNMQTKSGLDTAIKNVRKFAQTKHTKITGYILDLRNNPGGLVNQAVKVADTFLDGGEIVSTRGRLDNKGKPVDQSNFMSYSATKGDELNGAPLIVLVNGGTASAAEIVTGALHDHRRAIVLGRTTFGKGIVQATLPLLNGKYGGIRLTVSRYYTPAGSSIQQVGITPDIMVKQAKVEEYNYGASIHESDLKNTIKNTNKEDQDKADQEKANRKKQLDKSKSTTKEDTSPVSERDYLYDKDINVDYQLTRSVDLIHSMKFMKDYNQKTIAMNAKKKKTLAKSKTKVNAKTNTNTKKVTRKK